MIGSLEKPPITLGPSRSFWTIYVLSVLIFDAASFAAVTASNVEELRAWVLILISVLMTVSIVITLIIMLISPPKLTLSPEGLVWRTVWKTRRYEWKDFKSFHVHEHYPVSLPIFPQRMPAYETHEGKRWVQTLGNTWELPARDVVALLTAARDRWGPPL